MKYDHFDDEHREYVITHPSTPLPWINDLCFERYFSLISDTAGDSNNISDRDSS